ncbi:MAG: LysR family transcriptional regulator [Pseudomonadota bacterium]
MNAYLRHLANFARVVNAGSITAAANRENVSPSAMSESVKTVETLFGRPLLERKRSGVALLSDGHDVYAEANAILAALDRIATLHAAPEVSGQVRLSTSAELATSWVADAVAAVNDQLPTVDLHVMVEDAVLDHLKYTRDLYLRVLPNRETPGMHVLHRTTTKAVLIAKPGLVQNPNDLEQVQAAPLLCTPSNADPATLPHPGRNPITFTNSIRVNDITTRIHYARRGMGHTACLLSTVADDIGSGRLVRLIPNHFNLHLHMGLGTPRKRPSPTTVAVAALFAQHMPSPVP